MTGASGDADPAARPGWRWDVALSFAGAQRDYVEQVAEALKARGVRCFYDADEQIELWGTYLAEELPPSMSEQAAVVVVFVSADYAEGDWTRLERRAALAGRCGSCGTTCYPPGSMTAAARAAGGCVTIRPARPHPGAVR